MVSRRTHMPGAGMERHQVKRNGLKVSLFVVRSRSQGLGFVMLAVNHWCRIKMPISVCVMPVLLPEPETKGMQCCSQLPHLWRAQKDQMEQNRGFKRIISQTQGLLLELDTVCLVTIYLCNHQAQRSLFIKGPTPGSFGMLNTSADYKGLRSVQRIKDWTLFIVWLLWGGWLKS